MRAVNQSIGRAIRHRGDYAAVVLADHRWTQTGPDAPAAKLPGWMQQSFVAAPSFGDAFGRLARFFRERAAADAERAA